MIREGDERRGRSDASPRYRSLSCLGRSSTAPRTGTCSRLEPGCSSWLGRRRPGRSWPPCQDRGRTVGWFTGMVQRRFGMRLLGSPFPGWSTSYLGFNLKPGVDRRAAFEALPQFAFSDLRCAHLEVRCRNVGVHELDGLGFKPRPHIPDVHARPSPNGRGDLLAHDDRVSSCHSQEREGGRGCR